MGFKVCGYDLGSGLMVKV